MENKRDIEKNIQKLQEEKQDFANKVGKLLYSQSDSFVKDNEKTTIQSLEQDKKQISSLIKELDGLQERFTREIENQKILQAEIKTLSQDWTILLSDFGKVLLEEYSPVFSEFLGDIYSEYEEQRLVVKTIADKIDSERSEIEKMGFFSKILNQVKLSSSSTNLTMQEKKLQKLFVDAGHLGIHETVFTNKKNDMLSTTIFDAYNKAFQMQESLNEKRVLLEKAQNEEDLLGQNIDAIGPSGSFNKKKNSLEKQVNEIVKNIDALYQELGESFFLEKIGIEPKKTLKKPESINDEVFSLLKEAYEIQKKLIINTKKIEFLNLEAEIAQSEKQKKLMQQNIIQNDVNIDRLKEQNQNLSQKIVETAEEIDLLLKQKIKLSQEIGL